MSKELKSSLDKENATEIMVHSHGRQNEIIDQEIENMKLFMIALENIQKSLNELTESFFIVENASTTVKRLMEEFERDFNIHLGSTN